jgi:hypothetical protein
MAQHVYAVSIGSPDQPGGERTVGTFTADQLAEWMSVWHPAKVTVRTVLVGYDPKDYPERALGL